MEVGFLGLGSMGLAMARRLMSRGHRLAVYNRTPAKAAPILRDGARGATSLEELRTCEVLISMLADDSAVQDVFLPDGKLALPRNVIHVSMSTISTELAERLTDSHRDAGGYFIAAPVLGRPDRAAQGKLTVLAAGDKTAVDRCQPLFAAMGERTFYLGAKPSVALIAKLGINFMVAAAIESLSESFAFVRKGGVNAEQYLEIVTTTIFSAPVYNVYAPMIAREICETADFTMKLGLKDVGLMIDASERVEAPLPFAGLLQSQMISALARGYGDMDWAALGRLSARNAGLPEASRSPPEQDPA